MTFTFDMATDKAGRPDIDVMELFYFANPLALNGEPECDEPFFGECPVYDIANGLTYTTAWSDDGSKYTVQLQCPPPEGTPTVALGTHYTGAAPRNYSTGNASLTTATYNEYHEIRARPSASA